MTVFGGRHVSVMVVIEEEGSVSVPFSLEDGDSWTGVTGSSRFDEKDGEIRTGRIERRRRRARARMVWIRELLA
jgi:hypothetical protein